jgi:hypothetical protein
MKAIGLIEGRGTLGCGMGWFVPGTHMIGKQLVQLAKRLLKNQYNESLMNLQDGR